MKDRGLVIVLDLTPRKQKILDAIIRYYVASGEPVGSKLIADEIGVSSATVRNEMAELTEQGFLQQPHTSAGRIPAASGYRAYMNSPLLNRGISQEEKAYLDAKLSTGACDPEQLLVQAAQALSRSYLCAVTTPGGAHAVVRAVQFVQLSRRTGMLILMSAAGTVKSRMFRCDFDLSPEIMRIFFRVFNERVTGLAVNQITPAFLQNLAVSFGELSMLMTSALMSLLEAAKETQSPAVVVKGQMNLFTRSALDPYSIQRITKLLNSPVELSQLLQKRPGRFSVMLGSETGYSELESTAVVTARYGVDGKDAGVFAVIGPMRMDYLKVISHVKYVSDRVGQTLTDFMREEL